MVKVVTGSMANEDVALAGVTVRIKGAVKMDAEAVMTPAVVSPAYERGPPRDETNGDEVGVTRAKRGS